MAGRHVSSTVPPLDQGSVAARLEGDNGDARLIHAFRPADREQRGIAVRQDLRGKVGTLSLFLVDRGQDLGRAALGERDTEQSPLIRNLGREDDGIVRTPRSAAPNWRLARIAQGSGVGRENRRQGERDRRGLSG